MPKPVKLTPAIIAQAKKILAQAAQAKAAKAAKVSPAVKAAKAKAKPAPAAKAKAAPALPTKKEASAEMSRAIAIVSQATKKGTDYAPHWSPLQTAIFDFIRWGQGSAIVEAVAGSGKTTTICEGIRYMVGRVVALAFNRSIAKELKERLAPFANVTAGTVHSIGKRALEAAGIAGWVKVDPDKLKWIFQDSLETETNRVCKGHVVKLCTMGKDAGAGIDFRADDREAWEKLAEHFSIPTSAEAKNGGETFDIIALAQKLLALSNADFKPMKNGKMMFRIDFSDMVYLPVLLNVPMEKFDWVIVDEAQDLNLTRRLFIQALSKPATRHLIVGDTFQAIYGFTGADAESMKNLKSTFSCQSFPLSICYRCASNVIEFAQTWMPFVEAAPSAPAGTVSAIDYTKAMEAPHDFLPTDVILCRNNAPIVKTAMQFIRANISVKVEGNDLTGQLVNLANEFKSAGGLLALRSALVEASDERVAEAQAKGRNGRAGQIADMTETLCVFIDRAIETGDSFEGMIAMIRGFFSPVDDKGESAQVLTLSTIHKAKGREWSRVFWLGRTQFQPSKFAKKDWEMGQEKNLCYVAATRAKMDLVELENYPV